MLLSFSYYYVYMSSHIWKYLEVVSRDALSEEDMLPVRVFALTNYARDGRTGN